MVGLIPIISGLCYRLGGCGKDDRLFPFLNPPTPYASKWWRWGVGIPIALITGNPLYIITYYVATAVFVYGDSSWVSKLCGVKAARLIHGFMFGAASLSPLYGLWTAVVFYIIFELAEKDIIDNSYAEFLRGLTGTLIFL